MKNKIILLFVIFTFISSCGYTPVLTKKDYSFSINNIEKNGNKQINTFISRKLDTSPRKSEVKKIEYDLVLNSKLDKNTVSKDSKGDPSIFEMEILVEVEIKNSERNINTKRKFNKKISYNNKTDKFELSSYENTLIQNISENIAFRILSSLSNL